MNKGLLAQALVSCVGKKAKHDIVECMRKIFGVVALLCVLVVPAVGAAAGGQTWLSELNAYRQSGGVAATTLDSTNTAALSAHLTYLANTPASYFSGQYASVHTENPAAPAYTAAGSVEASRSDLIWGVSGMNNKAIIDGWLSSPFHAIGLLRPGLARIAFARNSAGYAGADVISGLGPASSGPVLFPGNGMLTSISTNFGGERPNPLESCPWGANALVGVGAIAMLEDSGVPGKTVSGSMSTKGGASYTSAKGNLCIVDAANYHSSDALYGAIGQEILSGDNAVLLFPRRPLTKGVWNVSLSVAGMKSISWSFSESG